MLLFDANLSPGLLDSIEKLFPNSEHVFSVGLEQNDFEIYKYARDQNLVIVSKDQDFYNYYLRYGFPPKIIWIKRGNCKTKDILELLTASHDLISNFVTDKETGLLVLR